MAGDSMLVLARSRVGPEEPEQEALEEVTVGTVETTGDPGVSEI